MRRRAAWAAWAAVVLLVLAGLALLLPRAGTPAPLTALAIATNTQYVGACAVMAAQRQGYFGEQRLAVTLQPYSSGRRALQAVLSGQAEVATVADIPVVFAALDGSQVKILSTIFRTSQDHGIVARRDRGISQGRDLAGKRIGVSLSTSGHFALDVFLNRQRLAGHDVSLRNYGPEELLAALAAGEVDAVAGWEPFLSQIEARLGGAVVRFRSADTYESVYNVVAPGPYLRQHPHIAVQLIRALARGAAYCREHPTQVLDWMPALAAPVRAALLAQWPSHQFGLELDQSLLLGLEDQARWVIRSGLSGKTEVPNFLGYIYPDALREVNPAEVSMLD